MVVMMMMSVRGGRRRGRWRRRFHGGRWRSADGGRGCWRWAVHTWETETWHRGWHHTRRQTEPHHTRSDTITHLSVSTVTMRAGRAGVERRHWWRSRPSNSHHCCQRLTYERQGEELHLQEETSGSRWAGCRWEGGLFYLNLWFTGSLSISSAWCFSLLILQTSSVSCVSNKNLLLFVNHSDRSTRKPSYGCSFWNFLFGEFWGNWPFWFVYVSELIEWEETQPLSLSSWRKVQQRCPETGSPLRQDAYPDGSS